MASEALRRLLEELSNPAPPPAPAPAPAQVAPPAATRPEAEAPLKPPPRPTRPGALPGDPPAPVVDPQAARILTILELAGAQPNLHHGQLALARPEHASPDLRAAAQRHQDDICALLQYRALLEQLWPVAAEPPPRPTSGDPNAI